MSVMSIDIETYSSVPIDAGVYAYAESPDFEILLVSFAFDDGEVQTFEPRQQDDPLRLINEPDGIERRFFSNLKDPRVIKTAFNANFERTCLARWYREPMPPEQWQCTQHLAAQLGLPSSLEAVGKALGLTADKAKLKTGKALIAYFCVPCRPTIKNGGRTRNLKSHDPDKWQLFIEYNKQDVVAEREIRDALVLHEPGPAERELWALDQHINDRGIRIDREMAENVTAYDAERAKELRAEARRITGLENPGSLIQLRGWLAGEGIDLPGSLDKAAVGALLKQDIPPEVRRVLEIRQALGKTSNKKYTAMLDSACSDDRVRGMLKFYGANRTGRWAGRIVQLQNLPQNHLEDDDLDLARKFVKANDFEGLELFYGEPAPVLSELIRTAFIPSDGCRFVVSDFNAIEARVIAWLAQERWRLDTFENGGDIYCASASQMFGVPVVKNGENGHLRQKGKIAELALGYGGGVKAMQAMDSAHSIPEEELPDIVRSWRQKSPRITALWRKFEEAAIRAITDRRTFDSPVRVLITNGPAGAVTVEFYTQWIAGTRSLFIRLPSGRDICYWGAEADPDGEEALTYWGTSQTTKAWTRLGTYGGKLTENIVQATARDCLAVKMLTAAQLGWKIVAHVHDEMIIDAPSEGPTALRAGDVTTLMSEPIPWAPGLPLKAGTYECNYYKKD